MSSILMINKNNENKISDHYTTSFQDTKSNHASLITAPRLEMQSYTVSLTSDTDKENAEINDKISDKNSTNINKKNDEINVKNSNDTKNSKDPMDQHKSIENKKTKDKNEDKDIQNIFFKEISEVISKCIKFFKTFVS